MTDVLPPLVSE